MKIFRLLYITIIFTLLVACGGWAGDDRSPANRRRSNDFTPAPTPAPNGLNATPGKSV